MKTLNQTPDPINVNIDDIIQVAKQYYTNNNPVFEQFVSGYYQDIYQLVTQSKAEPTHQQLDNETLAGIALHHFGLLKQYEPSIPQVAVFNPNYERVHFHANSTVIQIVAYDRPFLVDTLLMCLESLGVTVNRLHHTILSVKKDDNGNLIEINHTDTSEPRFISLIHCEITQQSDEALTDIRQAILDKINVLDIVVKDWHAMRDKLAEINTQLSHYPPAENSTNNSHSLAEIQAFLNWILDDNFIFLGYREYRYTHENSGVEIYRIGESGLGLLGNKSDDNDQRSNSFQQLPHALRELVNEPQVLLLSKSSHVSPVHRPAYMDFLGIQKFDENGQVIGEHRFVGLLTATAYELSANQIPLLRQKVSDVLQKANLPTNGHAYHKFTHILNTLPRDDVFQATVNELYDTVVGIANLYNKNSLRLFARMDHYQRFVSCLVFVPRDKFNTQRRMQIQSLLMENFGGIASQFSTDFSELHHVRLHVHVRTEPESLNHINLTTLIPSLEKQLNAIIQGWSDTVSDIFVSELGEVKGQKLLAKYLPTMPLAYQEDYAPRIAIRDIERFEQLESNDDNQISWYLYQQSHEPQNNLHLKVYGKQDPTTLSHILPILENFGLNVINAQTYEFDDIGLWLQEYHLNLKQNNPIDMEVVAKQVEEALALIWQGVIENDALNQLILTTPLDAYEVSILRALSHYMLQAKAPFSLPYIKETLLKYPDMSVNFVQLFHAKMRPIEVELKSCVMTAQMSVESVQNELTQAFKAVQTLDEDRILHWFLDLLTALLRTNYYQVDDNNQRKNRLSFKFSAKDIVHLPKPKPMFEIFVYSPRVEAVHLRGGKVARGGLRWSDRKEDFRTEVLGLVKAQMVKNAVIVPVGSKGGFIVKTKSMSDGRDVFMAEGIACYQTFIRGMLDITDNLVDGHVVPPVNTVRHDGDDPYLVVAADKGTASFSDIANAVSAEYGFWLGDAFASGGSVGYDHKAMGITARGAWESVKRHFRLMGKDIQNPDDVNNHIRVVGIGDMSGDVFGNGMLLSPNIELIGAFNHLHIFIDPTPDVTTSFAERERLFNLPRSTWDDYDKSLISQGGGVFSRQEKSIAISEPMKTAFGITADSLTPDELIHALLIAPVDLIWNGGIGTYVKSEAETNLDVGDRANDNVRINGNEVRAKVIGEGGNLGMTQRGRIEYAQNGGRLYTDAIDNSAGVNCSDHEVNIKILLGNIVSQGDMTTKQRNELLASMTDSVAELVLRQNYLQPQAIELSAKQGSDNLGLQQKFMQFLESQERLDRAIEFLPSDDDILRRQKAGQGLTNPELSVLLAYGKMWVYDNLLQSDLPDDSYFVQELTKYFPDTLSANYFEQMTSHPLHREIISTYLTNSVINRLGVELVYQLVDELDVSVATIVRAYSVVRDVLGINRYWQIIESLDNQVDASIQLDMELRLRSAVVQSLYWVIQQFGEQFNVTELIQQLSVGVKQLTPNDDDNHAESLLTNYMTKQLDDIETSYHQANLSANTQYHFAVLPLLPQMLDAVWFAHNEQQSPEAVARVYFKTYELLGIDSLLEQTQTLPQHSYWESRAIQALRGDIMATLRQFVDKFLAQNDPMVALDEFIKTHTQVLNEISHATNSDDMTFAKLSVLVNDIKSIL